MRLVKRKLGVCSSPSFVVIPQQCVDDKTIVMNPMNVLSCFKDRRSFAVDYMRVFLAHLGIPQSDKLVKWFYEEMPDNGYLEMDYGTNILSYCSVEKK